MELYHAAEILSEAATLAEQNEEASIFDVLREAQDKLGMSDGCRKLASRFIVRGTPYTSLLSWENSPRKFHSLPEMIQAGINELMITSENPYKGFIFCTCIPELQEVLLYG